MSRVVELADVREESYSLPELADFHRTSFFHMGLRIFRGNDVAIFGDDKSSVMAGRPELHKAVDQANANDAANGIPVDPRACYELSPVGCGAVLCLRDEQKVVSE